MHGRQEVRGDWLGRVLLAVGVGALLATPVEGAAQAVIGGEWRDDVSAFARAVIDAGLTPGMAVAVAVDGRVAWTAGFGTADLNTGGAVTPDTPFYIASSTKALTATAAILAAHAGELDLDAPLPRYLPTARFPEGIDPRSIRVRDLLTLTHGLSGNGPVVLRTAFTGEFTRDELLDLLRYHPPTGRQGTFEYNNLGYNLLGMVLEEVDGESWKEVVQRRVLDPVGMRSTTAYPSSLSPDHIALPHELGPEGFARLPRTKTDENAHAAGGHFATAGDLARYLAVHLGGGRIEGRMVFPPEPLEASRQLHVPQDREFGPYHRFGWGLGWDLGTYDGDTLVHRFGGFSGYRSHMSYMPEHGIGVVVLVNGDGPASPASDLIATFAYDRLLGKPDAEDRHRASLDALADQAEEARTALVRHLEERAARLAPLPHPLEAYEGVYESPVLGRMEWRVVAGGLELWIGVLRSRAEVFDATENRLRIELGGSGNVVEFHFDGSGPARSVSLLGTGVEFIRVDR
jgi:CubicO group peptidase (beta-lactamase class C family)